MLATVAAVDSASTVIKKYRVFIYSEAEPHVMYAIYKQTLTLCVLQYLFELRISPLPFRKQMHGTLGTTELMLNGVLFCNGSFFFGSDKPLGEQGNGLAILSSLLALMLLVANSTNTK